MFFFRRGFDKQKERFSYPRESIEDVLRVLEPILIRKRELIFKQLHVYRSMLADPNDLRYTIPDLSTFGLTIINALVRDAWETDPINIPVLYDFIERQRLLLGLPSLSKITLMNNQNGRKYFEHPEGDILEDEIAPIIAAIFQNLNGDSVIEFAPKREL